jgi:tousled-like kinase
MAKESWPIFNDRYLSLELLGKGGFSEVYRCFDLKECIEKAMKISHISANVGSREAYMKHVIREYKTLKALSHKHIIKVKDVIVLSDDCIVTILELCNGQDLADHLKKNRQLP